MPSLQRFSGRRRAGALLAGLVALGACLPAAVGAGASPVVPPTPEAVERIAEQYNLARLQVDRASAVLLTTERRIHAAEVRVEAVSARVRARAAAVYTGAGSGTTMPLIDTRAFADQARRRAYLEAAERPDQVLVDSMNRELRALRTEQDEQRTARAQLQRELDDAARLRRRLQEQAAAAESARRSAIDAAGPIATTPPGSAPTTPPTVGTDGRRGTSPPTTRPPTTPGPAPKPPPTPGTGDGSPPAPSAGAATAVAFARAQLGKPYAFATAGPATFDCSGLTMAAWAAAGVRMPHYSGSQATMFPKVSWEQLQPGDIVVFYDDLHHVGLYIGGGMMIHAPQTGDVVRIAPAGRTTFQWGVRPG